MESRCVGCGGLFDNKMLSRFRFLFLLGVAFFSTLLVQALYPTKKNLPADETLKWVVENAYSFHDKLHVFNRIITSHYSYELFIIPNHCHPGPHYFTSIGREDLSELVVLTRKKTFFGLTLSKSYQDCGAQRGIYTKKEIDNFLSTNGLIMTPYIKPTNPQ